MRQLRFSPRAIADIDGIWDFTAAQWGVAQADRYVRTLSQSCLAVARDELPGSDASHIRPGYRKQLSGRHVIYYRLTEEGAVEVVRVLHQSMDVDGHLRGHALTIAGGRSSQTSPGSMLSSSLNTSRSCRRSCA